MCVVPGDNYAKNRGVVYWAGFGESVDNNYHNKQLLTSLLTLSLFQRTELWVVIDDNSVQKKGMEYIGDI